MVELTEDIILNKDKSKDKLDLFIPLGTNFDATIEGSKPIAEKLFLLIKHYDPKRIDLFESLKSKKTTWRISMKISTGFISLPKISCRAQKF